MKKISLVVILLMLSIVSFAQKEVTKFLGIPVDGTKQEMEQKLKNKGFVQINGLSGLSGEFNGKDVFVLIQTVKGKVWRLNIIDQRASTETLIKEHFNNLCEQFKNNPKYQYFPIMTSISFQRGKMLVMRWVSIIKNIKLYIVSFQPIVQLMEKR